MQVYDDTGVQKKDVFGQPDWNQWAVSIYKSYSSSANKMHNGASLSQSSRNSVGTSWGRVHEGDVAILVWVRLHGATQEQCLLLHTPKGRLYTDSCMAIFNEPNLNLRGSRVSAFEGLHSIYRKWKRKRERYVEDPEGSLPELVNQEKYTFFASGLPEQACAPVQFNAVIRYNIFLCNHRSFGKQTNKNRILTENLLKVAILTLLL